MIETKEAPTGVAVWICMDCRDYNLDTDTNCVYCGKPMDSFTRWLYAVDAELADRDESRDDLPYQLWQWWEMFDHNIEPGDAANAALLLRPSETKPWPAHTINTGK
jgi:hypothetical protein